MVEIDGGIWGDLRARVFKCPVNGTVLGCGHGYGKAQKQIKNKLHKRRLKYLLVMWTIPRLLPDMSSIAMSFQTVVESVSPNHVT